MKLKKSLLIFFGSILVLSACNNNKIDADDKETTDSTASKSTTTSSGTPSKLEGVWEVKREDGEDNSASVGTTYEFSGSKLTMSMSGFNNPGTTEVTDNTFSFLADGGKDKIIYDYSFEGDTLVVKMQEGPQVFRLVKK